MNNPKPLAEVTRLLLSEIELQHWREAYKCRQRAADLRERGVDASSVDADADYFERAAMDVYNVLEG